ncbi:GNAT family N-acetyltransferase [Phaeovulum sp. W22_SRMD_FR3]|uniref:GNAT family N-acetyltransferase n=1 Tax=Phaeovulum sp. W22_SRMD_FR3 TaxID=3240274 RepID=UPI003F9BC3AF
MSLPDVAALAALHAQCFSTPRPWSAAEFTDLLGMTGVYLCGDAQGFVMGRALAGEAELLTLAVAPALRRQGRARALVLAFEEAARLRGAETAFLEVAVGNDPARALYAALGWQPQGRRKSYYRHPDGRPEDAVVMTRALAPASPSDIRPSG